MYICSVIMDEVFATWVAILLRLLNESNRLAVMVVIGLGLWLIGIKVFE